VQQVAIAEYADGHGVVRDRTFEDCEIIGPVALVLIGSDNRIVDCPVPYTPDWLGQLRLGKRTPVLLAGCTLRRCTFALDVDASAIRPS
jgi:hypothetical protein